ncbi:MAG: hypothetical protein CMK09_16545 [Ponticaulis sp.]|nr:hypothetical protein [Ponticaulis sp.]|tara:strand:+ start:4726 stop:5544 length:819 start_codon:yes stop_codon:yes gene_type:complete
MSQNNAFKIRKIDWIAILAFSIPLAYSIFSNIHTTEQLDVAESKLSESLRNTERLKADLASANDTIQALNLELESRVSRSILDSISNAPTLDDLIAFQEFKTRATLRNSDVGYVVVQADSSGSFLTTAGVLGLDCEGSETCSNKIYDFGGGAVLRISSYEWNQYRGFYETTVYRTINGQTTTLYSVSSLFGRNDELTQYLSIKSEIPVNSHMGGAFLRFAECEVFIAPETLSIASVQTNNPELTYSDGRSEDDQENMGPIGSQYCSELIPGE